MAVYKLLKKLWEDFLIRVQHQVSWTSGILIGSGCSSVLAALVLLSSRRQAVTLGELTGP